MWVAGDGGWCYLTRRLINIEMTWVKEVQHFTSAERQAGAGTEGWQQEDDDKEKEEEEEKGDERVEDKTIKVQG